MIFNQNILRGINEWKHKYLLAYFNEHVFKIFFFLCKQLMVIIKEKNVINIIVSHGWLAM